MAKPNWGVGEHEVGPDGLIDALPCRACGDDTLSVLMTYVDDAPLFWMYVCRPCQDRAQAEMAMRRELFEGLIAGGMSRQLANEVMMKWHGTQPT